MSDHIEALERLARMRADGTLTDAEFEAEKTTLLNGNSEPPPLKQSAVPLGHSGRSFWPHLKGPTVAVTAFLISVIGYVSWTQFQPRSHGEAAKVVADSSPYTPKATSNPDTSTTNPADAATTVPQITAQWLVGAWSFESECGGGFGVIFDPNGTYFEEDTSEGRYSTDGHSIRFYESRTVAPIGDGEGFIPEPVADSVVSVRAINRNTISFNGHRTIRCP